jgi:hypothetical protein
LSADGAACSPQPLDTPCWHVSRISKNVPAAGKTFPEIFVTVKLFRFLLTPYSLIWTFKCAELKVLLSDRDGGGT